MVLIPRSISHSDAECRIQVELQKNESTNFASHSCCSAVLSARDPPLDCDSEGPCVSITAAEAPAANEKEGFWPFGPKDEPVASFDSSGLFGAFGGISGEETDSLTFTVGE